MCARAQVSESASERAGRQQRQRYRRDPPYCVPLYVCLIWNKDREGYRRVLPYMYALYVCLMCMHYMETKPGIQERTGSTVEDFENGKGRESERECVRERGVGEGRASE